MDFGHSIQQSVRWLPWNERSATHSESYGEKKKTCSCSIVWGPCHFHFYVEASLSSTLGWSHQSKPFFCAPQKWPAYVWLLLHFFHRCSLWKFWRKCLMFQTVDHDIDRMVRHPILYLRQMWMVDIYTFMSFFLYYTHTLHMLLQRVWWHAAQKLRRTSREKSRAVESLQQNKDGAETVLVLV